MAFVHESLMSALTPARRSELLGLIDRIPALRKSLDAGGWICGGFPRHLMLDLPMVDYFKEALDRRPGDIDVFFSSVDAANAAAKMAVLDGNGGRNSRESMGGFAQDVSTPVGPLLTTIQFVNHPDKVWPSVEQTLEKFDFMNCQVAITSNGMIYPEGWHELERSKLIKINHENSPFMATRLLKYLNNRGLVGITPDSKEKLTSWLCAASQEKFDGYNKAEHMAGIQSAVKHLQSMGSLSREDLLFFIGKYKHYLKAEEEYAEPIQVDWALHNIGEDVKSDS